MVNHVLHFFWAIVVFGLGVLADIGVVEYLHHRPHRVVWQSGDVQTNYYSHAQTLPPTGTRIEIGAVDDGSLTWRPK